MKEVNYNLVILLVVGTMYAFTVSSPHVHPHVHVHVHVH